LLSAVASFLIDNACSNGVHITILKGWSHFLFDSVLRVVIAKRTKQKTMNHSQSTNPYSYPKKPSSPSGHPSTPATYTVKEEETWASASARDAKADLLNPTARADFQSKLARIRKEEVFLAKLDREKAERQRRHTQRVVDQMTQSTPEARIKAAKARAALTHTEINEAVANAPLNGTCNRCVELDGLRIDDLDGLFAIRETLPLRLRERIKKAYAKVNWKTENGDPGYFNVAVHENHIPIDGTLTILAHIESAHDGTGKRLDGWVDSVLECGLFPRISQGKFEYRRRCQDADACELCNYLNISDGLKTLFTAYDRTAFNRGGNWFAITVAPRIRGCGRAVGRLLTREDWDADNSESVVYREQHHKRVFRYPDPFDYGELGDHLTESGIRRFLGATQFVFGKTVKNGWLDGIRGRVENSIEFMPYASHQHWHAVGSSLSHHDPQSMAEFMKVEIDKVLAKTLPELETDVVVAQIPSAEDLRRWVQYMNKTLDLVGPVSSLYNRYPNLRRSDPIFERFMWELRLVQERSRRVFSMKRHDVEGVKGSRAYSLHRRFVRGTHRFGAGTVLTESKRHQHWRKNRAKRIAMLRKGTKHPKRELRPAA
jgi:hypothetical protein